jgi:plastocyanin
MTVRIASFVVTTCLIAWVFGLSAAERRGSKTHTVTVDGMSFQPDDLTVASGDTVVWVNKDLVAHTATSETGGFDSSAIQPEESWKVAFKKKGEFPYFCRLHPTMQAMLRVK